MWFLIIILFCERLICVGFLLIFFILIVKFFFSDRFFLLVIWILMLMVGFFLKFIIVFSINKLYFIVNWEYKIYIELLFFLNFYCLVFMIVNNKNIVIFIDFFCLLFNGEIERWVKFLGNSKGNIVGLNIFSYRKLFLCV